MPDQKLPDRPIATSADDADLIHIVDVSDTTDSPQGTSKQITRGNAFSQYQKNNQTITLSGDATGSGTTSITVTVVDNSHNHTIGNVAGLQAQLNLKANLSAINKALIDALGINATTLDGIDSSQFLRSDVDDTMTGNFTATGAISANGFKATGGYYDNVAGDGRIKLGVWAGTTYGFGMDTGFTFGGLGNDYAITSQMDDSITRGYWWGTIGQTNAQGNMALTNDGFFTVAAGARIGFGQSDTTKPSNGLQVSGTITSTGTIQAPLFLEVSDKRLKTKIKDLQPNHIPVKWKEFELKSNKGKKRYGVIAQELEKTNPELVHTNEDGFKSVNYIDFLCIKSAEQENEIEQLKILVKQLIDNGTTN
jgi:hypothetical protein